ncbi:hypothetical protein BPT24_008 [Tenacibaculum phage pT24]|uniref:Uncharacterized protein n=1 Tax=Tenacibaculum phage pT24 TaxID=1880590 RepID=A0A1B4XWD8_9CAUD|nr:hypothetical protein HYP10_gp008 [Tenacibaculum phage pT24]BAV39130.1 hypothetical protein BPT24_008 [Tenacibaculum phage pT24]
MSGFLSQQTASESKKHHVGLTKAIKYVSDDDVLIIEPIKFGDDVIKVINVTDDFKEKK